MKKKIFAAAAVPDMVLAEDVYSFGGQQILSKGSLLDNRSITRLKFYSINEIEIVIEDEEIAKVDFPVRAVSASQEFCATKDEEYSKEKSIQENFRDVIRRTTEYREFNNNVWESARALENSLSVFITNSGQDKNTNKLLNQTKEIIAMSSNPLHTFHMLQNIRNYDDATFIHCLNVAVICNAFGKRMRFSQEDLDILTLSGLLHDIGKMKIPEAIIKKPGSLTDAEYSVIKMHPRRGYNVLQPMRIDDRIKKVALAHHERRDGSGYPSGLKGDEIDEFAKIISIADIYDAMTSARVYRGPLCPFEVISIFEGEGYQKFDPKYLIPFLEGVVDSYLNYKVVLSDGRCGTIIMNNKQLLSRPVVKVREQFIDLSREKGLVIKEVY